MGSLASRPKVPDILPALAYVQNPYDRLPKLGNDYENSAKPEELDVSVQEFKRMRDNITAEYIAAQQQVFRRAMRGLMIGIIAGIIIALVITALSLAGIDVKEYL